MSDTAVAKESNEYIRNGYADKAILLLESHTKEHPHNAEMWKLLGFAYHEEQLEPEAAAAFEQALSLKPQDFELAILLGQSQFYSGYSSVGAFQKARHLQPENLDAIRGYVMAVAVEGDTESAGKLLDETLTKHPGWLTGHKLYSTMRYVQGDSENFASAYASAYQQQPDNIQLLLEWFNAVVQNKDWNGAEEIIQKGRKHFGSVPQIQLARLFLASESKNDKQAVEMFKVTNDIDDAIRDMAILRYYLRHKKLEQAEKIAIKRVSTASARVFLPYLDIIWRLKNSLHAQWLNGRDGMGFVKAKYVDLNDQEMLELATLLRKLHTNKNPFSQQSVRGGTQTDQNLFLRHEPIIRRLSESIKQQVAAYVRELPKADPSHPMLGIPREDAANGRMQFSGSWSVRLESQGRNVSHTHPLGWISSALYISLPSPEDMGPDPAGWIQFGDIPPELELHQEPVARLRPEVGKLVMFPSTIWHSTIPFEAGERLVVAFDVRPGRH